MIMRENNIILVTKFVVSFVIYQHRDKVNQHNNSLLVRIYLPIFNFNKLVANIFTDMKHYIIFKHVFYHQIVLCLKKLQNVVTSDVEVWII